MTEQDTFNKLRRTSARVVDDLLFADYTDTCPDMWYFEYISRKQGNMEKILEENGWDYSAYLIARQGL